MFYTYFEKKTHIIDKGYLMELRNLYDKNKKCTQEIIPKKEKIPFNRYEIVVLALIQNSNGEFLIQKRSPQKGGTYALTAGHPIAGESSLEGIIREIKEEIGISVSKQELQLWHTQRDDKLQCFFDLYYLKKDFSIQSAIVQKEEVDFVEWDSFDQVNRLCLENKFKKEHIEAFQLLTKRLNSKKIKEKGE